MTICVIHQPNLFPRLVTLAKLLAADCWVVLDDVQYCRRDFQSRSRLGSLDSPAELAWLSLPVRLPVGRATRICDVRILDSEVSRRRILGMTRQFYGRRPGWAQVGSLVDEVAQAMSRTDSLAEVAELSTTLMLERCGWRGRIIRSGEIGQHANISGERSERLADLTRASGCRTYLSGRAGRSYLRTEPFAARRVGVSFFELSAGDQGRHLDVTALAALAEREPGAGPGS